jgi:demethylmenaquinone methyltransferase/2-methoxy-6-polyprenyl-1,4-benzoquinol methylase
VSTEKAPELPHGEPRLVAAMFHRIAPRYDLLNRLLSFGLDTRWRKRAARLANLRAGDRALDVAAGTGDLAFDLARQVGPTGVIVGQDLVRRMLVLGRAKARARKATILDFHAGDALHLPYRAGVFRAATMAFGGRNVPDLLAAFREMARVVAPGGRVVFLELNRPTLPGFRHVYDWYFHTFSPLVGGLISGDREAYSYLPRSVDHFEGVSEIKALMEQAGLSEVRVHRLTFGAAFIHVGSVPAAP